MERANHLRGRPCSLPGRPAGLQGLVEVLAGDVGDQGLRFCLTKSASLTWLLGWVQQCTEFEASEKAKAAAQAGTAVAKAAVKPAEGAQQEGQPEGGEANQTSIGASMPEVKQEPSDPEKKPTQQSPGPDA